MTKSKHKFGKVVMLGEPNVGKSSLVNALVGERVSAVTEVSGTTRQTARGILTGEGWQIVFLDTPGMQKATKTVFDKSMNKSISAAAAEADVICYVVDINFGDRDLEKIANYRNKQPLIIVVNKVDKTNFERLYPRLAEFSNLSFVRAIVPASCKSGFNLNVVVDEIVKLLPEGEALFDADDYTDQTTRKIAEDSIRAQLMARLHSEVPHGINVEITRWKDGKELEIDADIICNKESHKPIVIGKGGGLLKAVGIAARKEIEDLVQKHVRLNTHVVVKEGWKDITKVES